MKKVTTHILIIMIISLCISLIPSTCMAKKHHHHKKPSNKIEYKVKKAKQKYDGYFWYKGKWVKNYVYKLTKPVKVVVMD